MCFFRYCRNPEVSLLLKKQRFYKRNRCFFVYYIANTIQTVPATIVTAIKKLYAIVIVLITPFSLSVICMNINNCNPA
jgi:hypothetical protein